MTTYLPETKLGYPAINDQGYPAVFQTDLTTLDNMATVGDLYTTTHEQPSASLLVDVSEGTYVAQDGTVASYAGISGQAVAANSTKVLYLDLTNSGALTVAASYPTTPHIRLATVTTGATTVASIADNRQCFLHAGQRIPLLTHLLSTSTTNPGIAAGSAAGTVPALSIGGTDVAGTISITTGTSPGTGTLATITFAVAYGAAPRAVILAPGNSAAAGLAGIYSNLANLTTAAFTIDAATAPAASTAYKWSYLIVG